MYQHHLRLCERERVCETDNLVLVSITSSKRNRILNNSPEDILKDAFSVQKRARDGFPLVLSHQEVLIEISETNPSL